MNYVLFGEEQLRLKKTLETIIKKYVKDDSDLNVIRYDAMQTDLNTILADASTVPFFSDYKVIVVDHARFLSTNNDTGQDPNLLIPYMDAPMETTILIFVGDFAKLDTRKKIVKKIKQSWKVLEFAKLDELGKQSYVSEEIKKYHIQIQKDAYQELLNRLPLDMESISREIEKLALYQQEVTKEVVTSLVTRPLEDDVFELVNAVVEKNIHKAFRIWKDLSVVNTDAIYLIALLASQFRFMYQVKTLMEEHCTKDEITSTLHAHPYRVKLTMQSVDRLSLPYLMEMLAKLATLDQQLKGGLIDKKMGFEMFLIEL